MILQNIYARKIERTINPAVVVSDKTTTTIEAEIGEYIFTDELIEKLYQLLDTVINKQKGKSGIWINGYYGSGKSHFIKYAHYCLDSAYSEKAFDHFMEKAKDYNNTKSGAVDAITISNLALLKKKVQSAKFDNILFNVEDETDDGSGERLTRIFLNMFNKFRGYNSNDIPLAILLEKTLDRHGKFQEFKDLVDSELGYDWEHDAASVASFMLENVLEIAKRLVPELDTVALHAKLSNPDSFKIGINATLIPELQEFLKTKDKSYRLLFLVDEISQYIGKYKEILLNFQNIIERVSDDCNNQVWIACTAQQRLDEVSDGVGNAQDEFGKILGRFDTRISLQSNDASYITQKRVLEKNSIGVKLLGDLYESNKDYLLNQFKITHELYKGYQGTDDFILAYPFIPYQFKLIAHVFEAFQQLSFVIKEVKDNERSVLGITHYTAIQYKDKEIGDFIPFDAFYNQQFHTNLTHRGTRAIQNAFELPYVTRDSFEERVVKNLFMISNLLENQRQTFPSNIENLTVLMMTELDQNKMKLQNKIKTVLERLVADSIIRAETNGTFFFFNEDEMDVQNMIKNQIPTFADQLDAFDTIFFRNMVKISTKVPHRQNDFKMGYSVEGKEIFRKGDFNLLVLLTDVTPLSVKALNVANTDAVIGINEWFMKDEPLRKEFEWFCKTLKFMGNHSDNATGERSKTIENFKNRNDDLRRKLQFQFQEKFAETRFISQQRVLEADQIAGSTPKDRVANLIKKHLDGIYKNHHLAENYAQNTTSLKKSAAEKKDVSNVLNQLSPAEELVNDFISLHNDEMTVDDLIKEFEKPPYGWRHETVLDILVHLVKKKKREFVYRNTPRFPIVDFINKAVTTSERTVCQIKSGEEISQSTLDSVVANYREIFNEQLTPCTDSNELYQLLRVALEKQQEIYASHTEKYFRTYPFGQCFYEVDKTIRKWLDIHDPKTLFKRFGEEEATAKQQVDEAKAMADWADKARKDYDAIRRFHVDNLLNFQELPPADQEKAENIASFLQSNSPRREYRHIRKAYDEIKNALKERVEELKTEVISKYETVFEELQTEAVKHSVTEANIYADKEATMQQIQKLKSIPQLKNRKLETSNFRTKQLTSIVQFAAANAESGNGSSVVNEPEVYYITNIVATIKNEAELDAYLAKARKEMLDLLANNKTILIK
ncbi:MAG: putative transcriptional regulator [Saprospiraceae bacterium]|jgi:predicted transcriptional regulator